MSLRVVLHKPAEETARETAPYPVPRGRSLVCLMVACFMVLSSLAHAVESGLGPCQISARDSLAGRFEDEKIALSVMIATRSLVRRPAFGM